eukprot:gene4064-4729_t
MFKLIVAMLVVLAVSSAAASSCATTGCPATQACYGASGSTPSCYTYGNCGIIPCPVGQSCLIVGGHAQCVVPTTCPTCSFGSACYFYPGTASPDCYAAANCGIVPCPTGQSCLKTPTGGRNCVVAL